MTTDVQDIDVLNKNGSDCLYRRPKSNAKEDE